MQTKYYYLLAGFIIGFLVRGKIHKTANGG